jgi:hypothetical protein
MPAGAEGGADGNLALARRSTREQQMRHVRAGDEKQEGHGGGQQQD